MIKGKKFSLLLNLKMRYHILYETYNDEVVGGNKVGKIYYGFGSGDYRFPSNKFKTIMEL